MNGRKTELEDWSVDLRTDIEHEPSILGMLVFTCNFDLGAIPLCCPKMQGLLSLVLAPLEGEQIVFAGKMAHNEHLRFCSPIGCY